MIKRGTLNFLGRKNQSLFDTNVKMKEMENVELVLESSAIPESGTASVRARPTVKHHASTSDSFQGFAVPTPKVPLLAPINGPKINGSVGGDQLSNGSVISVADPVEGEILVPPPPSIAPPPPPETFIPPPPDFMGDLNSLDLAALQPPSMPAPKQPAAPFTSLKEEDLTFLQPPPMAPPKPPSTCSSGSASSLSISSPPPANVPEHPKFAPPQPPTEKQQKTFKTPPPKPIRLSSISNHDSPPQTPAPPPPVQTPTLSTFNPQNTAKLYNIPKHSILSGYEDRDPRPKQILVLEDSGSVNSVPMRVQVDGKSPKVAPPSKPVSKYVQDLKENVQVPQPSQPPLPEPNNEPKSVIVPAQQEVDKPLQAPHPVSPQLQKVNSTQNNTGENQSKPEEFSSHGGKFSPLIDRKLRSLKSSETNGVRDGPAASPLALLMAAKEREKHRSSLSQENSGKKKEQSSIQPSDLSSNSFVVIPRSTSSSFLTSQERLHGSPKPVGPVDVQTTPKQLHSTALVKDQVLPTTSAPSKMEAVPPPTANILKEQKQDAEQSPPQSESAQLEDNKELNIPLLPPPPEFDDLDEIMEPPPAIPPPDPPVKKAPTITPPPPPPVKKAPTITPPPPPPPPPPSQAPSTPPKPTPPPAPKLPPPDTEDKPKPQVQTKPKVALTPLPTPMSASQATLLSILQKKMLEMDHKISPVNETESNSDDWGTPLSDEDSKVPAVPRVSPQKNNYPVANKSATLDMRELEGKIVKKYQATSSTKVTTSNGPQSTHQYGMTFTVRPGTKQPITVVNKGDSS